MNNIKWKIDHNGKVFILREDGSLEIKFEGTSHPIIVLGKKELDIIKMFLNAGDLR